MVLICQNDFKEIGLHSQVVDFILFLFQPTKITRRSPSPSIISPSLPPRVRRVSGDHAPWMETGSGKHAFKTKKILPNRVCIVLLP